MKTDVIGVRIDPETSIIVKKIIEFRIVKNKADAIKFLMKHGMAVTKKIVDTKEKSHEILGKWKKEGFPDLPEDLSDISITERE